MAFQILLVEGSVPRRIPAQARWNGRASGCSVPTPCGKLIKPCGMRSRALLILDLRRLRFDGLRFCNSLIAQESPFPILLILADGQEAPPNYPSIGILRGVTPRKLLRRVRRLLSGEGDSVVRAGDIFLDLKLRVVRRGGREHRLTPRQTRLLEVFLRHPGRVLSRAFLMREVWETDYLDDARTLEVHVHWLRKAIEDDPHHPVYLKTVRKVGYVLDLPMASSRRR